MVAAEARDTGSTTMRMSKGHTRAPSRETSAVTNAETGAIFVHSMFRTGSTFLAARYAAHPGHCLFYEPFIGGISSKHVLEKSARTYEQKRLTMRHDKLDGGYFGSYFLIDPQSGKPVYSFHRLRFSTRNVYDAFSNQAYEYLAACIRAARADNKNAVFGFCRSGLQVAGMRGKFPGTHIYLLRDPHHQFKSYAYGQNDYFIPQTFLQIGSSPRLAPIAASLLPQLKIPAFVVSAVCAKSTLKISARLGRQLTRNLTMEQAYTLFYLSWLVSTQHGEKHADTTINLMDLYADPEKRAETEQTLGITLDGLRQMDDPSDVPALNFAPIEAKVEAALAAAGFDGA